MILTQPIAFVDIETTGLDPETHEIIELGVVIAKMKDGIFTVTDKLDVKIQPKHIENADPVALRVNGYNEGDWLFGTSIEEALKSFVEKTDGAIFTAHNMAFDYGFVEANLKRHNIPHTMHYHKLDTISVAFGVLQNQNDDMGKYSLRVLCEKYGIINPHAHSAYADAYATYEVFKKLLNLK